MYLAELHGKVTSRMERMEDVLTSNVFSFFKYSNRRVFLRQYLRELGISVCEEEANQAKFIFWPRFAENTEPDLVIRVGGYYVLIEAKYFSGFGKETQKKPAQLLREIEGGRIEAKNYNEIFRLVAITADYYYKKEKFEIIPLELLPNFRWTNWQTVCSFLESALEKTKTIRRQDRDFAFDLYSLLDRKNLRSFKGVSCFENIDIFLSQYQSIFFEARTAMFRGDFIGFTESLSGIDRIRRSSKTLFFDIKKKLFAFLTLKESIKPINTCIFWKGP